MPAWIGEERSRQIERAWEKNRTASNRAHTSVAPGKRREERRVSIDKNSQKLNCGQNLVNTKVGGEVQASTLLIGLFPNSSRILMKIDQKLKSCSAQKCFSYDFSFAD